MKIVLKVESILIKKHKFQSQTPKLEKEMFLQLAQQANSITGPFCSNTQPQYVNKMLDSNS